MIGVKTKKIREAKGWSRRELGRRMGKATGSHITQIEMGKRPNLSLMTACELAKAFEISLDELVEGTEYDRLGGQSDDQ